MAVETLDRSNLEKMMGVKLNNAVCEQIFLIMLEFGDLFPTQRDFALYYRMYGSSGFQRIWKETEKKSDLRNLAEQEKEKNQRLIGDILTFIGNVQEDIKK